MTVKELIIELQKLPENATIWFESSGDEYNPSEPTIIRKETWGRDFNHERWGEIKYRHIDEWVIR